MVLGKVWIRQRHLYDHKLLHVLPHTPIIVAVFATVFLAFEIIVARRTFSVPVGGAAIFDDFAYPPFFGIGFSINRRIDIFPGVFDALRNMSPLCLKHKSQVELERCLIAAHYEQVRIS